VSRAVSSASSANYSCPIKAIRRQTAVAESSTNSNYSLADDQDDDRRGGRLRRLLAAAEPADRKSLHFVAIARMSRLVRR
jgi:hypothetical protein